MGVDYRISLNNSLRAYSKFLLKGSRGTKNIGRVLNRGRRLLAGNDLTENKLNSPVLIPL